jgi:hypothetical protein
MEGKDSPASLLEIKSKLPPWLFLAIVSSYCHRIRICRTFSTAYEYTTEVPTSFQSVQTGIASLASDLAWLSRNNVPDPYRFLAGFLLLSERDFRQDIYIRLQLI